MDVEHMDFTYKLEIIIKRISFITNCCWSISSFNDYKRSINNNSCNFECLMVGHFFVYRVVVDSIVRSKQTFVGWEVDAEHSVEWRNRMN